MPYTLTTPQAQAQLGGYRITNISIDVEAGTVSIQFATTDPSGVMLTPGPGGTRSVTLSGAALTTFLTGQKSAAYTALVAALGLPAGTTS